MKTLILTPFYTPDLGPSAPLFYMLANELAQLGQEVTVIAAVPHYETGRVADAYKKGFIQRSVENNVNVVRVRVPSLDRSNLLMRAIQFITYQVGATIASLKLNFDIAFVSNPAIEIWLPFIVNVAFRKKPAIYSIHDLYPHVGVTLGVFKNKLTVSAVAALEKSCLHRAEAVRILSNSFRDGMKELGVPDEKMILLYDWVDTDLIKPLAQGCENCFAGDYNLEDKFVVMYAGNIGLSQGLEYLLEAAEKLADHEDIHIAIVGEGTAKKQLMKLASEKQLKNVSFIPFQPRERLPEVLAAASLSLVMLRCGVGATALPSKTYSIFASGRPILASVDGGCETADLIVQSGAGICIEPEDSDQLVEKILYLKDNPDLRSKMGMNGRKWAEKYHSPKAAAAEIEKLSNAVLGEKFVA